MSYEALQQLTSAVGLPDADRAAVTFTGSDPVFKTRYKIGTAGAAALAAVGVAASHLWAEKTGRHQKVAIDLRAAAASLRGSKYFEISGQKKVKGHGKVGGFYPVRNGRWVFIHGSYKHLGERALQVLGAADPAEAREATKSWTGQDLEDAIFAAGGVATFTRTPEEWAAHPQSAAVPTLPVVEIIKIGDAPPEPLPAGPRPLSNIRALDLTRVVAGPTCTRILCEHGADVLKVSRRDLPNSYLTDSLANLGKRSCFLDLRVAEQEEQLRELVRQGDVFSQSYRPGTLAARGFGPEDLAKIRPGIIYVSLSAWGAAGPWKDRRGYDSIVANASGMAFVSGVDGKPQHLPVSAQDYIAGYLMAYGTMVALRRRAREGGSWLVRVSLARAGLWLRDQGMLSPEIAARGADELEPSEIAALQMEQDAPEGHLIHLAPVLKMSETQPFWARPPSILGADPPTW